MFGTPGDTHSAGRVKVTSVMLTANGKPSIYNSGTPRASVNNNLMELDEKCGEHAEELRSRAESQQIITTPITGAEPCRERSRSETEVTPEITAAGGLDNAARSGHRSPQLPTSAHGVSGNEIEGAAGASGCVVAHDATQGGALGTGGLTAANIRMTLEADPSLMKELGLTWVQRTPAQLQADVDASAAVVGMALQTVLDAATAAAAAQADIHAATFREVVALLESLRTQVHTRMGRQTYQTVLSVLAGTEEHSVGVSPVTRAAGLGVRRATFLGAQARVQRARHDVPPATPSPLTAMCTAPKRLGATRLLQSFRP